MGGSSAQTVGYWYSFDIHFGLAHAIDALVEVRGGDKPAWVGRQEFSGEIQINAENIWGGIDGEGGIVGPCDVMMGEADQPPNAYLQQAFGEMSAFRGKVTFAFKGGRYGAFNPYPKPIAFKVERILEGWPGDEPWYPETAKVQVTNSSTFLNNIVTTFATGVEGWDLISGSASSFQPGNDGGPCLVFEGSQPGVMRKAIGPGQLDAISLRVKVEDYGPDDPATFDLWDAEDASYVFNFTPVRDVTVDTLQRASFYISSVGSVGAITSGEQPFGTEKLALNIWYVFTLQYDGDGVQATLTEEATGNIIGTVSVVVPRPLVRYQVVRKQTAFGSAGRVKLADVSVKLFSQTIGLPAMNPAHMLYYSKVSPRGEAVPVALMDDENWRAQADTLFAEGFGLCTAWNQAEESAEAFQDRICGVIGGAIAKSRRDGKWRLYLMRGNYDKESLPVLSDADILEWTEQPSVLDDAVNQMQTKWFDPANKEERITAAEHALGAISAYGGVVSQTLNFPEIPVESLALRVNSRELNARSTPLTRLTLVVNRVASSWDTGTYIRLQAPRRGIEDMVVLLGDNDVGATPSSAVKLVVVQDIYSMPETSYVEVQDPIDTSPSAIPLPAPNQRLFESPYVELAAVVPPAELAALQPDVGFVLVAAQRPSSGVNYSLYTAAEGEEFENQGSADWCPTAVIDAGSLSGLETEFLMSEMAGLSNVVVGSAALWGEEICRVDAIDTGTGELTLGRGCADTVPAPHAPSSRIFFYDTWASSDRREYVQGETVRAKALTRTSSAVLALADAPLMQTEIQARAARPYPPARVRINDEAWPVMLAGELTVEAVHRDRVLQADQLFDQEFGSMGPEPGTTYTVRTYVDGVLDDEIEDLAEVALVGLTFSQAGFVAIEISAVRDGLESLYAQRREFIWQTGFNTRVAVGGDRRVSVGGDPRISIGA